MKFSTIVWVVAFLGLVAGGWYFYSRPSNGPVYQVPAAGDTANAPQATKATDNSAAGEAKTGGVTITYTDKGFSPADATVKKGESVTFVNKSQNRMWVGSDPHPSHTGYSGTARSAHCPDTSGTALDQCVVGDSYTFTFNKTGTWGYHNHVVNEDGGKVTVTE